MKYAPLVLVLLTPLMALSQDMVLSGGTMTVAAGTQVRIESPVNWQLAPAAVLVNNGLIDFGTQGTLVEAPGSPITGTGTETAQWAPVAPLVDAEPGGLGLRLNTAYADGGLVVERGHLPLEATSGVLSVARWFRVVTPIPTGAPLLAAMRIDPTELNGIDPSVLGLCHSADGQTWEAVTTSIDLPSLTISGQAPSPEVIITGFDPELITGSSTAELEGLWRVAPTLVEDWVRIESLRGQVIQSVELLDGRGRSVSRQNPSDGFVANLKMIDLPSGAYVIVINGGQDVFKVVKR